MDKRVSKKIIEQALQHTGLDVQSERFKTEVYHLDTLVGQGQTVAQALATVTDSTLRAEVRPFMYAVELSAVVIALRDLGGITPELCEDFQKFLREDIAGI